MNNNTFITNNHLHMTNSILHHIKKLLRIGVVATVVAGSTVNASAQNIFHTDCEMKSNILLHVEMENVEQVARIKQ